MAWLKGRPWAERRTTVSRVWSRCGFGGKGQGFQAGEDGLRLEDHAFAAAEGPVVDGAVAVVGEGAKVVRADGDLAELDGPAEDAVGEGTGEEVGKDGEDVDLHG